jgi:uncharacterized protein YkwD
MQITRFLRPTQKILTGVVVAVVTGACVMSATGSTAMATKEWKSNSGNQAQATKEWKSNSGNQDLATKEWKSRPGTKEWTTPFTTVAQQAYPAMSTSSYERNTFRAINRVRAAHHLRKLTSAGCASRLANKWSAHLANTHRFYHRSMVRALHLCHARYAGETLGMGTMTPKKLVSMWMHSPPHRHILMSHNPHRLGIGATPNSHGQWVVAANFLRF